MHGSCIKIITAWCVQCGVGAAVCLLWYIVKRATQCLWFLVRTAEIMWQVGLGIAECIVIHTCDSEVLVWTFTVWPLNSNVAAKSQGYPSF
jgi:hypothetical protein